MLHTKQALVLMAACICWQTDSFGKIIVTEKTFHLGTKGLPEWNEFAGKDPHGRNLSLDFEGKAFKGASTLFIKQDDVKQGWRVSLNGKRLGSLERFEPKMLHSLKVPEGTLRDGKNNLKIEAPVTAIDDIMVGEAFLKPDPQTQALSRSFIKLTALNKTSSTPLPCRFTITDSEDYLMPLQIEASPRTASRTGVIYSIDGKCKIGVLPGDYLVHATRGFEYGVDTAKVSVAPGETKEVTLKIAREVPTDGWVSCDPHIHVRTYSGHGDSTVEERMPTISGEGIELPIATDHNHHTDFAPFQKTAGAMNHFTSVIGNEVTTSKGHFNAFPINKGARLPDHKKENWPELFRSIRATPGVEVILLNHPRNVHSGFSPTDPSHFNKATGNTIREGGFEMDAIEVLTSAALQTDYMGPFRDWFAMLNSGRRITAAGSSDTHDVNRYILGQGRTYIRCPDKNPGKINVKEACRALRQGKALVSMGLLTTIRVAKRYEVGDLAKNLPEKILIEAEVLGPRWTQADQLTLYSNGIPILEKELSDTAGKVLKQVVRHQIPKPKHDVQIVAIATGPGVTKPYWEIPKPYQHKSKDYTAVVLGATNPVWLDCDGDGSFTSPNEYAKSLVEENKGNLEKTIKSLSRFDQAVAAQAAGILSEKGIDLGGKETRTKWGKSESPSVLEGFSSFLKASKK